MNNAEQIYKTNMNKSKVDNYKFKLSCQDIITHNKDTTSWIDLMDKIDHTSGDYKIFTAILDKKKPIIVKIGNQAKLQAEYDIANNLNIKKLPNFIKFFCYFKCLNNLDNIEKNKSICSKTGDEQGIIIMPYYELGQIDKYKWTRVNFDNLKNVLKHVVCSLLYAYEKYGFIHNDTHLGNILLKKSKKQSVTYNYDIQLPVMSILPIIMDFDRSKITNIPNDPDGTKFVYIDIRRIFNLISSELDINIGIFDKNYIINKYISDNTPISKDIYKSLLDIIDTIQIAFIKSELKMPVWT